MKKTILSLVLCLATSLTFAQTPVIDTTIKNIAVVRINPVKASFQDTALSVFLACYVINDNLKNQAIFNWALYLPAKDTSGAIVGLGPITNQGNYTMTPEQYALWCHPEDCNTYPFLVIGQAYGLTFPPLPSTQKK